MPALLLLPPALSGPGRRYVRGTRKLQVDTKSTCVHIDRPDEIAVTAKPTSAAGPVSTPGFVRVPASGTSARGTSFGGGRARDASLFGFVREIFDIAHAPFRSATQLVICPLQLLPALRVLRAMALFLSELPELLASLPLECADATSSSYERLACVRGDGGQMNLPQINGRLRRARSRFCLREFDADMQLEAPVPHEHARPGVLRKSERQGKGRVATTHRQHNTPLFPVDGMSRPPDRVETLRAPGVLRAHLGVLFAQGAARFDGTKEGTDDLLHHLGVEGKLPFRGLLQLASLGPLRVDHACLFVQFHAEIPDTGRLASRAALRRWKRVGESLARRYTRIVFM